VKDDVTPHDEQDEQLDDEQLDEMAGGSPNYGNLYGQPQNQPNSGGLSPQLDTRANGNI
jgi:hypothetical protein